MKLTNIAKLSSIAAVVLVCALTVVITMSSARPADADADSQIVFAGNQSGTFQLYTMHPDGSHIVQITHMAPSEFETWTPDISPDGRRIVFCFAPGNFADNLPAEIYTINVDGSNLRQITHDGAFDCAPRWSPDSSQIIFARVAARTGRTVVATMQPDGSQIHDLTTDLWGVFHSGFTPDRRRIVWETQEAGFISVLWIMDADGSHKRRLTPAPLKCGVVSAPSVEDVLCNSNQNSPGVLSNVIMRVKLDGSDIDQLTQPVGTSHDLWPAYSPSRRKIVFVSDRMNSNSELEIFTMNADGTGMQRIATGVTVGGCFSANCVNPAWGRSPH